MNVNAHAAVTPVVDPALAPRTKRWVRRLIERKNSPASKLLIERAGPVALTIGILGAFANGLTDPWLLTVAASASATFAVWREVRFAGLRRHRRRFVESADLDEANSQRLGAAQSAIETVLASEVYRTGKLDGSVSKAVLEQQEWEIARRLWDISTRRVEYMANRSGGVPGPHTAAVLKGHAQAITIAQNATSRRVEELLRFANEVRASDRALADLRKAEQLALGNDRYLDLVVATAADEHAITELIRLANDAVQAREAYQVALDRAMVAAGPLALSLPICPANTPVS
ncbi:MAG TPA: hypothetical protein VFI65_25635 [Streptosporangiaceae bacterium]|nr:hypothetical protein [Streptosporangiaceae bacterium]